MLVYSYKTKVEIAISFDPVLNRSICLWNLIAVSAADFMILAHRGTFEVRPKIFVFQVKLKSKPSPKTLDLQLFLSKEKARST